MFNAKKITAGVLSMSILCLAVPPTLSSNAAYSGSKASSYAVSHAKSYNTNYTKQGLDCTNFVSQCIYAGGTKMYSSVASWGVAKIKSGCASGRSDEWFYCQKKDNKKESWSSTWTVVDKSGTKDGLRSYLKRSSKNTYSKQGIKYNSSTFYNYVKAGDVVQLSSDGGKTYYHSIIITSVVGKNVYYCCHTNDRKSANMKDYISKDTTVSIFRPKA